MKTAVIALIAFYIIGFGLTFWVNMMMGNIMLPLIVLRSLVWPYFWLTGGPG